MLRGDNLNLFQVFVLFTLFICTIIAILKALKLRNVLKGMQAMTIAMVMGMNTGLTAGVLFGSFYQGDLYFSTIISMGVGAAVGFACGIIFGILPSLEGLMAGVMAGMMGAMLGEMITPNQSLTMINILLTFTASSLILFNIFPNDKPDKNKINKKSWFFKPVFTFIFVLTFLLLGNQLQKNTTYSGSYTMDNGSQHDHEQPQELNKKNNQQIIVNVHPSEFTYTPSKIIVKKNEPITIILKNQDQIDHDIEIRKINIHNNTNYHSEKHKNAQADFHLHASANSTSTQTIIPMENGTYEFYCSLPGHKENGMKGTLVVK